MALTPIQQIRLLTQDNAVGFYFCNDDELQFFLDRNSGNVNKAALEAARVILLQISLWGANEQVDIFSISGGSKSAAEYRASLELFVRNPQLNPIYSGVTGYAGGVSISDMKANSDNADNNTVTTPLTDINNIQILGI